MAPCYIGWENREGGNFTDLSKIALFVSHEQ